jgi:uncharacterized protein YndB with AHSA1/START domain
VAIEAETVIPAPPEDVFDFLSDLDNHWRLSDRFVKVSLNGDGDGGAVQLRGPLGLRRTAHTRVTALRRPRLLIGIAELNDGTRARVSWTLASRLGQTRVRLSAEIETARTVDRALLATGGEVWMQRAFERTLERLAQRFSE